MNKSVDFRICFKGTLFESVQISTNISGASFPVLMWINIAVKICFNNGT